MQWTKENIEFVRLLYNEGKTDKYIADYMGSTVYAICKLRSEQGFVKFKKREGLTRQPKTEVKKECTDGLICTHVSIDGKRHLFYTGANDEKTAKATAHAYMIHNGLKEATLFKPYKRLTIQGLMEETL